MAKRSGKFYFKNEKEVMLSLGLQPTKGSGSGWIEKEDGQNEHIIAQLKSTDAQSFRLRKQDIETLEYNGAIANKIPVFVLQFLETNELYLVAKVLDIPSIAEYIECGECKKQVLSVQIDAEDEDVKKKTKIISSGNRNKFWSQKQKEWEANGKKSRNKGCG